MNAYTWLMGLLDEVGSQPKGRRVRQCVAHCDSSPSMSVRCYPDGSASLRCFAGCTTQQMLRALHLTSLRLRRPAPVSPAEYVRMTGTSLKFPPLDNGGGHPATRGYRIEAVHPYGPAQLVRYRHPTTRHKELAWETLRGGRAIPGLFGVTLADLPLYREREVLQAVALGEPVLLVESESSVDALRGWYATTWAGSAWAVQVDRLARVLGGYGRLVVIPDNDKAGHACLATLDRASLAQHVLMPAAGQDARDLHDRYGRAAFADAVDAALGLADVRRAA